MAELADLRVRPREASAEPGDASERRELRATTRHLRWVLGIGLFLWNVIGVPNDVQVTETFGLSYEQFTWARIVSSSVQLAGWSLLFVPGLSRRGLRVAELMCFVATSAGLAALNHGIAGPTVLFLSCALLAQGASIPRPWREGLPTLALTLVTFPVTLAMMNTITDRNAGEWDDLSQRWALLYGLFHATGTLAFVVLAGDALHGLRRRALAAERIGRYRLVERLGGGAMGEVWRARHPGLEQDVALKLATRPEAEAHLVEEASILSLLVHPSTVRLVDRGRGADGRLYFAMELLRGETLAARVTSDGPLSVVETRAIGVALGRALAEAHARGVVHRDVKPENVMLCEGGFVKLIDFGVAIRLDAPAVSEPTPVGSPRFMAPEQRRGEGASPQSDVFALGAVLFFARTAKGPLDDAEGPTREALDATRLSLAASSDPLDRVLHLALDPDRSARPDGALALVDRLLDPSA